MPREVYDPKRPELEFYNKDKREHRVYKPIPKVKVSPFARRKFMFLYGAFLTFFVIIFFMMKWGLLDNIPFFASLRRGNNPIEIKINNLDFYGDAVVPTIELKNINYTNDNKIYNLKVLFSLYKNKKLVFNGNNNFYNISFPNEQRIGFKIQFDKNHWNNANKLEIILNLDDNLIFTNNINISKLKK